MTARRLILKFASKCRNCGTIIPIGKMAWFDPAGVPRQRIWHLECQQEPEVPNSGKWPESPGVTITFRGDVDVIQADDIRSLMAFADQPIQHSGNRRRVGRDGTVGNGTGRHTWYGIGTLGSLEAIFREGSWQAGADRLMKELGDMAADVPPAQSVRRRLIRGPEGDTLDIHKVLAGRLDIAWESAKRQSGRAPQTVTIVADVALACNEDSDLMFYRSAAAIVLADILTNAGYSVEIMWSIAVRQIGHGHDNITTCVAKGSSEPLDIARLAATMCLGGIHRHLVLKAQIQAPYRVDQYFGSPTKTSVLVKDLLPPDAIVVDRKVRDLPSARAWLTGQLKALQEGGKIMTYAEEGIGEEEEA